MARLRRAIVTTACLAALASAPVEAAPRGETEAQRLHRKGVHCMEVLERTDCAVDNFEALLDLHGAPRELATDAMMRLVDLYREGERADDVAPLLRRFWDVGMRRGSHGHVPWSIAFLPSELDMLVTLDLREVSRAPVMTTLGPDVRDTLLSCDEGRRRDLEERRVWRRAAKQAEKEGRPTWEIVYEERDREARDRADEGREPSEDDRDRAPIFAVAACPVARALGHDDLGGWNLVAGATHHRDARLSAAVAQIPALQGLLAQAEADGRITPVATDHWILPGLAYAGGSVHLLWLDHEELTVVPDALVEGVVAARSQRKPRLNRELSRLIDGVPRDTAFFMVATQAALREIGFSSMKRSTRSVLEAVLPRPKGLQIAAVMGDKVGVFTRVPTDMPVKGRMLVQIANAMLARSAEDDPEAKRWLDGLDIAEASDRRALLASWLVDGRQLRALIDP